LSKRPAQIVADIAIALPRPRHAGLARQPAFTDLVEEVFAALADGMADAQPKAAQ